MTIRLLDGSVLIRGGDIALHEDCCCTPPCWPDPCIIPSCSVCNKCWNTTCLQCLTLQSIEFSVDGVTDATVVPIDMDPDCSYSFDGCKCNSFNATFIHDFSGNSICSRSFDVDTSNFPFNFDTCGTPQSLRCNGLQIDKSVSIAIVVATKSVSFTAGGLKTITIPCRGNFYGYVCTDYTIAPGHFAVITLESRVGAFGSTGFLHRNVFIYSFGNGVKADNECADDQFYPTCNWTGGTATRVLSYRYNANYGNPIIYADCLSNTQNCNFDNAVVTVEAPVTTACTEEEDP